MPTAPAKADRIALLDDALENGGDLWQFGTATLKGFADVKFDDEEMKAFEEMLDPNDPLLQMDATLAEHLKELDAVLASDGDDLSAFGTRTLNAALAVRETDEPRSVKGALSRPMQPVDENVPPPAATP